MDTMNHISEKSEQEQLLHSINIASFAVVDLTEYLDTHPTDQKAIEYFNYYCKMRCDLIAEYSKKYQPLTIDNAYDSTNTWRWGVESNPWEGGIY
ncbi:MAG: spore coat protein CotJB [Eubacteriales bacterium]